MSLFDPFQLFGRLLIAAFKITGYIVSYGLQALWHLTVGDRSHVGDAIGKLGSNITDALADIFRNR